MLSSVLTVLALAIAVKGQAPGDPDFYNSVANLYSSVGCANSSLIYPNPIWGTGGFCQSLDPNNDISPIISYEVYSEYPNCTVTIYTTPDCTGHAYPARLNTCVSANGAEFVAAFVECPFSSEFNE